MKMLILGATGFLGSMIFGLALKTQDIFVKGTSRYANENRNIIQVDVTDKLTLEKVINQLEPEVVIWSLMNGEKEDVLIDKGLINLLTVIKKETKLIFLSTDALFVDGAGNYMESDQTGSLPKDTPLHTYVNAKRNAENIIKTRHLNHVILRTGPLYGEDYNRNIEQRTERMLKLLKNGEQPRAASNLYKTFVHGEDLSKAILEISRNKFTGILHMGPMQKESYYSFYVKRLLQLGFDNYAIRSYLIEEGDNSHLPLDTSLNTQKANYLLETTFRNV